jgi:transcriptional regulator with XRE-family HTH domain
MAKTQEKNLALRFRKNGRSIKDIAKGIGVSKSTVSLWCRDVCLSKSQMLKLRKKMIKGGYEGRLKGARMQYERRIEREKEFRKQGLEKIGRLSERDFLIAGVALYWGEGQKKGCEVRVSNSDPKIIKFMLRWFKRVWGINKDEITPFIIINKIHKNRVDEVEQFWSKITKIPKEKFTKTTLIKAKNRKNYKNFPVHYGTLTIRLKNPTRLHHRIIGMIDILSKAG